MFIESKISESIIEAAGICQNCFIKFNEYDEHQTMANQIQVELMTMYRRTGEGLLDMKPEIKIENEALYYEFEDNVVDEVEFLMPQIEDEEKKPSVLKLTKVLSAAAASAAVSMASKATRKTSYIKIDKDAGLIVCMIGGVKHYQCEFCGKKDFTSRSRLKTHTLIHTSERNYMCQVINESS